MYLQSNHIEECTGCAACVDRCPLGCIAFLPDDNGFKYPVIDKSRCVNCNLCKNACPSLNFNKISHSIIKSHYAVNSDQTVIDNSSSGGFFYEIAKAIIEEGGIVYGAAWSEGFKLKHASAKTMEEIRGLMGSKYVQSDCSGVYAKIEKQLKEGIKILFVGTPCQVAGVKSFLGKDYNSLLLIDFICHGVPSQSLFDQWIKTEEAKEGTITYIKFRDKKKYGWQHCLTYITCKNGKSKRHDVLPAFNPYYYLFLRGYTLRDSCYKCQYATLERCGDITIGDYWHAEKNRNIVYDDIRKGVSLVLCNTEKGIDAIGKIKMPILHNCNLSEASKYNLPLSTPTKKPNNIDSILKVKNISEMYKRVLTLKSILKDSLKRVLPRKIYYYINAKTN